MRCGSIVSCAPYDSSGVLVAKVIQSVKRVNPYTTLDETINVIKLHYNGELYLIPDYLLRPSTPEEKKRHPRNTNYWRNVPDKTRLTHIFWTDHSVSYYVGVM